MLLIITHKTDFTADFLVNKLNNQKIPYRRLNCEDIPSDIHFFGFDDIFTYSILGHSKYSSVWFRRTKLPEIKDLSFVDKAYVLNEYDSLIKNLFTIIDAEWISDPYSIYKAENKLFQLKSAISIGFKIPETIVTNSKDELRNFFKQQKTKVIVKPISQTKNDIGPEPYFIFTNRLKEEHIANLNNFSLTPSLYQREIEKDFEIRVTVVKGKVFAAKVDSQNYIETKTDWRRKKIKFEQFELPVHISDKCIQLVHDLHLSFGAIDLVKDKYGNYIFLEINPNGQWAWIESDTGMQISNALIHEFSN